MQNPRERLALAQLKHPNTPQQLPLLSFLSRGLMVLFFASFLLVPSFAQAGKYHSVTKGETLEKIARTYRVSVYEIAKANRISSNSQIKPGSHLYIPTATKSAAPKTTKPAAKPAAKPAVKPTSQNWKPAVNPPAKSSTSSSTATKVRVASGDSLWGIAQKHNVTIAELASANGLSTNAQLTVGQELKLPGRGSKSSSSVTVSSSGGNSKPKSTNSSTASSWTTKSGTVGSTPTPTINKPNTGSGTSDKGYQWPIQGVVLRNFENKTDSKHFGLDIEAPVGTAVRAAKGGKVVFVGRIPAYGNMVIVSHDSTYATCYAYCSTISVKENQKVDRGEVIAKSGDPGKSNSPYFHFQIRKNGDAVNPRPFLP